MKGTGWRKKREKKHKKEFELPAFQDAFFLFWTPVPGAYGLNAFGTGRGHHAFRMEASAFSLSLCPGTGLPFRTSQKNYTLLSVGFLLSWSEIKISPLLTTNKCQPTSSWRGEEDGALVCAPAGQLTWGSDRLSNNPGPETSSFPCPACPRDGELERRGRLLLYFPQHTPTPTLPSR